MPSRHLDIWIEAKGKLGSIATWDTSTYLKPQKWKYLQDSREIRSEPQGILIFEGWEKGGGEPASKRNWEGVAKEESTELPKPDGNASRR